MQEEKKRRKFIPPMPQVNTFPVFSDPFGAYTGLCLDPFDEPQQDADDL